MLGIDRLRTVWSGESQTPYRAMPPEGDSNRGNRVSISKRELALVAATRGALGVGAGLLLASTLPARRRKIIGSSLLAAGVLSTIPIAMRVFRRHA